MKAPSLPQPFFCPNSNLVEVPHCGRQVGLVAFRPLVQLLSTQAQTDTHAPSFPPDPSHLEGSISRALIPTGKALWQSWYSARNLYEWLCRFQRCQVSIAISRKLCWSVSKRTMKENCEAKKSRTIRTWNRLLVAYADLAGVPMQTHPCYSYLDRGRGAHLVVYAIVCLLPRLDQSCSSAYLLTMIQGLIA
ncbi:hypothetical protein BD289DRAFT_87867 [Coniella lustricola]|uniref:Uncharacterized protein n=1 Tax=Coniella lustricola TaxID=2025994 RepID=A0A2T2ZYQ5_9PEZI|nr:hypothetical protein BD289DRAFT_87867 [Coniella lustricola]